MIAVLTGDIVSSRSAPDKRKWLKKLEEIVERRTGLSKPQKWGIFRGDGFQVELASPPDALKTAVLIRSGLKAMPDLDIDARIGIGIGEKGFTGKTINESDGQAFQWSGNVLDSLKDDRCKLQMKSPWNIDPSMNLTLRLASVIIDDWTDAEAEVAFLALSGNQTQEEMAKKLHISQPAVHKRFAGGHLREILHTITYFRTEIHNRQITLSE